MIKNYTIIEKEIKEISASKASIRYVLLDEQGQERVVEAFAKLGMTKKVKSLKPIYQRETPLVEALTNAEIDDVINVDFTEFNRKNKRISASSGRSHTTKLPIKVNALTSILALDSYEVDLVRLFKLFLIGSIGFIAYLAV